MDNLITGIAVIGGLMVLVGGSFILSLIGWSYFCSITGVDQRNSGFKIWAEMLIGLIVGSLFFVIMVATVYGFGALVNFFIY